ncbi:MAG: hypothetical protein J6Z38_05715 [Lachnospiraceae bacterium]|nr:hypothetical protein [Lachnospiraceae bacterium]
MTEAPVRKTAYRILTAVLTEGKLLNEAFAAQEERIAAMKPEDRGFLRHLAKGVLERKVTLDALLAKLLKKPPEKQKPALLTILYMGLYELYYMRTENYAAVNEYVRLTERTGLGGLKGLVNSVLRRADEERDALLAGLSKSERAGVSPWLWKKLKAWYPDTYQTVAAGILSPGRPLVVRRMISKGGEKAFLESLAHDGITAKRREDVRNVYELSGVRELTKTEAFQNGLFYVQDVSSVLAGDMVADLITERPENAYLAVLDVCAAPGGKTVRLADEALYRAKNALRKADDPNGAHAAGADLRRCTAQQLKTLAGRSYRFVACDVSAAKLRKIEENKERLGLPFIETRVQDAEEACPEFNGAFDLVIADVPCSGIGIIGEKPDIQLHLDDRYLSELEDLQRRILDNVLPYVRKGGTLAYSTCTLNPGENGAQVRRLLELHDDLELVFERTCLPGIDDMRGFYMARIFRKG